MAISKKKKQAFAQAFMICKNGREALEAAGIDFDIKTMQSLLLDKELAEYIDENLATVQYMLGRDKSGHLAKLEKLFDQAAGYEDSKIVNFDKVGRYTEKIGKFTDFKAAAALSKRIGELQEWETTGGDNEIIVDLKIGDNLFKSDEEAIEKANSDSVARDEKVLNHLKSEGVL